MRELYLVCLLDNGDWLPACAFNTEKKAVAYTEKYPQNIYEISTIFFDPTR